MGSNGRGPCKTTLTLPAETMEALRALARERSTSMTQIIRRGIDIQTYLQAQEGATFLIERPDRPLREVVFP